jgi:ribosome-binding protein aMBF1 (putative translation factor)
MKAKAGNSIKFKDWLDEELKDPDFKKGYEEARLRRRIARKIIEARQAAGMTQAELARKLRTKQQAISRVESGEQNVTVELLENVAHALGAKFDFAFRFYPRH